jgi:hypothetical protein
VNRPACFHVCWIAGIPECRTASPPSCPVSPRAAGLPSSVQPDFLFCLFAERPGPVLDRPMSAGTSGGGRSRRQRLSAFTYAGLLASRNAGLPVCPAAGLPSAVQSGFRVCACAGRAPNQGLICLYRQAPGEGGRAASARGLLMGMKTVLSGAGQGLFSASRRSGQSPGPRGGRQNGGIKGGAGGSSWEGEGVRCGVYLRVWSLSALGELRDCRP